MPHTNTLIIGAGHAGLAMSRCLADRGVDHVVLEQGDVGEGWRTARWDSFRLLTPNWLTRLPGWGYTGPEPDGFMHAHEFVEYLSGYARSYNAPICRRTAVLRVEHAAAGFAVHTPGGVWLSRNVVVATGYHSRAKVPDFAAGLGGGLAQVTAQSYRSPRSLPAGGVLVVGASSSGVQIAHELAADGRPVLLSVGGHTRLPRRYRGRDILWWMDRMGRLDRSIDEAPDAETARAEPSLQLVATSQSRGVDLGVLQDGGVRVTGRLLSLHGEVARFADDLAGTVDTAQRRLGRLLSDIDRYAAGVPGSALARPDPPPPVAVPEPPSEVDLRDVGISAVVWATGYQPQYPWLAVPVLDRTGQIRHRRGVTDVPGLYAIGLRFQHRRNSTFIDGARHDAEYLARHITSARAVTT
jgi:putative flavoprotein involved in K+ transport